MKKNKKAGKLNKILKLISVLEKCNGKAAIGGKDALISPKAAKILVYAGLGLLTVLLFFVFFLVEPFIAPFIPISSITLAVMLIVLLLSFVLAVKNIVTVLYTADDLPVLLPMPFSAGQIVAAKLAVASRFSVILSLILMNSVCLGLGVRAGMGAAYIIGAVLSSVLVPLTGLAIAALLIVIVFRLFGFIRNRDITMVLGGIFTLILTVAYIIVSNSFSSEGSGQAATAVFTAFSSVSSGFPNIDFMGRFMFDGNILGLIVSIAVTAAVLALAMLAVKLFYIPTALAMENTGSKKKTVTKDDLVSQKSSGAFKALKDYESKNTRRNPAYMIYGFAMTFIWPLLVGASLFLGKNSVLESLIFPLDTASALLASLLLGIIAASFACGFNVLAATAFSREGDTFSMLRTMPFDFKSYYRSKRDFALLICTLGSVGYVIIIGIVCLAAGVLTLANSWVILYGAAVSFLLDLVYVNWMLLKNSKKPYFNWDTETEIARKLCWINVVAIIIGVIMEIGFLISLSLSGMALKPEMAAEYGTVTTGTVVAAIAVFVIAFVLAVTVNRYSVKKGAQNLLDLV